MKSKLGLIGLGTMGAALARNLASRGFTVSLWNRTYDKIHDFAHKYGHENFYAPKSFEDFIESLEWPRKIILMVPAGEATQAMLKQLAPVLSEEDVIMDGGNAIFRVTEVYQEQLQIKKIHLLGAGISGGEEGALNGPSIMPGGDIIAWEEFQPILTAIAAEDFEGKPCVSYMGRGGAGHYVKMVHNGIEYAEIQMLAEAYDLLRKLYKLSNEEIAEIFADWNEGKLNSYLTEIAVEVLRKEEDGTPLLDLILDKAGQKGTGQWTSQESLALGVPTPSITGAVFARSCSVDKETRVELAALYPAASQAPDMLHLEFANHLGKALFASRIANFEQGLAILRAANGEHKFNLNFPEILRVWQGGCIIRGTILKDLYAFTKENPEKSIYFSEFAHNAIVEAQKSWRIVVGTAIKHSIPVPALEGALTHFESYRQEKSPANFIQGLRDHFGSHGYERI